MGVFRVRISLALIIIKWRNLHSQQMGLRWGLHGIVAAQTQYLIIQLKWSFFLQTFQLLVPPQTSGMPSVFQAYPYLVQGQNKLDLTWVFLSLRKALLQKTAHLRIKPKYLTTIVGRCLRFYRKGQSKDLQDLLFIANFRQLLWWSLNQQWRGMTLTFFQGSRRRFLVGFRIQSLVNSPHLVSFVDFFLSSVTTFFHSGSLLPWQFNKNNYQTNGQHNIYVKII